LELLWGVVAAANRYVDTAAPWSLRKSDPQRMRTVLWALAETIRHIAILAQPAVPAAAGRLLDQLAVPAERRRFADLGEGGALRPGTQLPKPEGIFPRHVEPVA
jgi:methionyl-tRNA synthetase